MTHSWDSQAFADGARAAGRSDDIIDAALAAARNIRKINHELPVILTLAHLGHLTDVSPRILRRIVDRQEDPYRIFRLKKKAKGTRGAAPARPFRLISVPHPTLMRTQRWIAQNILNLVEPHGASYAFAPGRDLMGAAQRHAGCRWLVKMDVRRFFESINETAVYEAFRDLGYGALVAFELARLCTRLDPNHRAIFDKENIPYEKRPQGYLPQGAPTSPMLANLAVRRLDERLEALAKGADWIYTRYADDIAFSTTEQLSRHAALRIVKLTEKELSAFGLVINHTKTTVVPPGARKILLGVLVDRERPRLSRAFRNNIETHLYALTHPKIGPTAHRESRGFASTIGMRRHIEGLIAFAHQVDPGYARGLYASLSQINWQTASESTV